jgi:hypothetical protein
MNVKITLHALRMTMLIWFVFWGYILYCLFWPPVVFKYNHLPLTVSSLQVKPGDKITYTADYCKYIGNVASITHSLQKELTTKEKSDHIADIVVVFDTIKDANVPINCHVIYPEIIIPKDLDPGRYRIVKNIHTKVNMFRVVDLEFYSEWFNVI